MASKGGDGSGGPKPVDKGFFQALDGAIWANGECDVQLGDTGKKVTFTVNSPQFKRSIELKEGTFYPLWDPHGLHIAQDPDYGGIMTYTGNGTSDNLLDMRQFQVHDNQTFDAKPGYNRFVQHRAPWFKEAIIAPGAQNYHKLEIQFDKEPTIHAKYGDDFAKFPQGKARLPFFGLLKGTNTLGSMDMTAIWYCNERLRKRILDREFNGCIQHITLKKVGVRVCRIKIQHSTSGTTSSIHIQDTQPKVGMCSAELLHRGTIKSEPHICHPNPYKGATPSPTYNENLICVSHRKDYWYYPHKLQFLKRGYYGEKAYYDGTNFGCELDINYKVYYGTTDDYYAKSYVITEATRQTNTKAPNKIGGNTREIRSDNNLGVAWLFPWQGNISGSAALELNQACLSWYVSSDDVSKKLFRRFFDSQPNPQTFWDDPNNVWRNYNIPTWADLANGMGYEWEKWYTQSGIKDFIYTAFENAALTKDLYWVGFSDEYVPEMQQLKIDKMMRNVFGMYVESVLNTEDIKTTMNYTYEFWAEYEIEGQSETYITREGNFPRTECWDYNFVAASAGSTGPTMSEDNKMYFAQDVL